MPGRRRQRPWAERVMQSRGRAPPLSGFLKEVRLLWDNRIERGHTATGVGEKDVQKQRTKQGPLRMRVEKSEGPPVTGPS